MKASIIIVNYNTPELTRAAVGSVLRHSEAHEVEVIVVDNASTVGNLDNLNGLDGKVKLIRSTENLGFARGNNLGIDHSTGDLIVLLNSDAEFANDCIGITEVIFQQDPFIGILTGQIRYPDGRLQYPAGRFASIGAELKELLRLTKGYSKERLASFHLGDRMDSDRYQEVDWVWGAYLAFPRTVLDAFTGKRLPTDYFMYYEDVLWCFLARKAGYKVVYAPSINVIHHLSASLDSITEEVKYRTKIFPNEKDFMFRYRGGLYARAFYLVKALHYLSIRDGERARFYFRNGVIG